MLTTSRDLTNRLSERAVRTTAPPIAWLMNKALGNPDTISLAAGFVDQQSLPVELVQEITKLILKAPDLGRQALQYGYPNGYLDLRRLLAERLQSSGISAPVDPEHIVVTSGSQQLLYIATDVLIDVDDIVIVEDPTYFVYTGVLDGFGARTIGVATDDEGMIPEALEERLKEIQAQGLLHRVKMLYLMTYYQNPKGTSHSWKRCEQIYDIICRFSTSENYIYILEDAAYCDLSYEGDRVPFMKTLDTTNERVILALTFSKSFSPGLRLGYGYLPPNLIGPVLNEKGNQDFGSSNFTQFIAYHAVKTGLFDDQVKRLCERYAQKRNLMLRAIREEFPPDINYVEPKGGLYVWVTLPDGMGTGTGSDFCEKALDSHVLYVPGCYCYAQEKGRQKPDNQLRLCYGSIEDQPMVEGIRRLGAVIRSCM